MSLAGERLGALRIATDAAGYEQLLAWARSLGRPERFGIEGTGSYGQGLVSYLRRHDMPVLEAGRPDRRDRRNRSKTDTIDAENAAPSVLAGRAGETPRHEEGTSEMIRQIKVARDIAVKARSQAIITLKTPTVTAPDDLRAELEDLSKARLRDRCAGPGPAPSSTRPRPASTRCARSPATGSTSTATSRPTTSSSTTTTQAAPALRAAFGIGPDVAAEMLILAGDRPRERLHSEAAFASLCGASPIPASSGMTQRHRLKYGGQRQANSALYRAVIVRMRLHPATIGYVARRTAGGKTKREIIRCLKRYVAREIYHYLTTRATPERSPIIS